MEARKKNSLLDRLGMYISILLGAFLLSFFAMYNGIRRLDYAQKIFMERTIAGESVSDGLENLRELFGNYRNSWNADSLQEYREACGKLKEKLGVYARYTADAQETGDSIRRLDSFIDYQLKLLQENKAASGQKFYDLAVYVNSSILRHQAAVKEMTQIDMEYAREAYEADAQKALNRVAVTVILSMTFMVVFGLWSVRAFGFVRRAMRTVNQQLRDLGACNWDIPDLALDDYQEFDRLSRTLNVMKNQIKEYMARTERDRKLAFQLQRERLVNEQQRAELIEAQMATLRAQVNPHFLFNALNMIGSAALVDSPERVMQLVEATGKILRYSLYTKENMVFLDEEVEIVRQYLFLQKHRYGDALCIEIQNRLEGEELMIPPMSIQPIVENCFKHGFNGAQEFEVKLHTYIKDGRIVIQVSDNGAGFDPTAWKKKSGIGLSNIEKRLKLQYGPKQEYLFMESQPGHTEIMLKIPLKEDTQ